MKVFSIIFLLLTISEPAKSYDLTADRIFEVESQIALPPDPGLNGDAQLLGYDVDGNSIRDDIQRYLEVRYFDEPKLRAVFYDYASYLLNRIVVADQSTEFVQSLAKEREPAYWCLIWLNNNNERDFKSEIRELRKRVFNTIARHKANMIFHSKLAGMSFDAMDLETYRSYCVDYGLDS